MRAGEHHGFTLIECLIVLILVTILTSLASPMFSTLLERAHQQQVIYQLKAAVLLARHTSLIERTPVHICPFGGVGLDPMLNQRDEPECVSDYRVGVGTWIERDGTWQPLRLWRWDAIKITNRKGTRRVGESVSFDKNGLANRNMTWSICAGRTNLSLVLNRVGRPVTRFGWGEC